LILEEPLKNYHFGAKHSTEDRYDGVDMRGEVLIFFSNVNIIAKNGSNVSGSMSAD
jgi:hypothetical protein